MLTKKIKELIDNYKWFVTEIWNGLEDDITIDKTGEQGYKNEKECIKAIRKFTLPVIKKKWKELCKMEKEPVKQLSIKSTRNVKRSVV